MNLPIPKKFCILIFSVIALLSLTGILYHLKFNEPLEIVNAHYDPFIDKYHGEGVDFANPKYCIECHREETEAWQNSHHHLANETIDEEDIIRLLTANQPILDERAMAWRQLGDQVLLKESDLPDYPLVGKIGITPLIQYLYLAPDGRVQAHDIAWDVNNEEWFSVFEIDDANETEPRKPGEWGHWTGQGMNWDANCAYCHMTDYRKRYDALTNTYQSQWANMGITCAQCHPGMKEHLNQIKQGNTAFQENLSIEQMMENCAACHSRRDELTPHNFHAGEEFEDHFNLTLADTPGIYHPDGQVIGENYVYGSLTMSKMGHAGISCLDCHNPHSNRLILPVDNNALCMRCHGSGLQDAPRIEPISHSRHSADSSGNRCIECHMPTTHFMGRDGRRDHSFSHPDPTLSIEMGVPNACTQCHTDQTNEWAKKHTDEWYGPQMNADRRIKARLIQDVYDGKPGVDSRLRKAFEAEPNRFWKATFVSLFQYMQPTRENFETLLTAIGDPDPMVRSSAVRVTGLESLPPDIQEALLNDPVRQVRIAASSASQDFKTAKGRDDELQAYLHHNADSPSGALRFSAYWQSRGNNEMAANMAKLAPKLEPNNVEVWRLTAVQLHGLGYSEEAQNYLKQALALSPNNPTVLFNRGLLYYETGNTNAALKDLLKVIEIDPYYESAWYNLILLYSELGQQPTAQTYLQEALQQLPNSQRLQQLNRQL